MTGRLTIDEGWHEITLHLLRQSVQLLGEGIVPQQDSAQHLHAGTNNESPTKMSSKMQY